MAIVTDQKALTAMGVTLRNTFDVYKKNRYEVEQQWLRNLRQTKGHYDPEMESKMRTGGSRAYPRVTRVKVIGTTSRIMEMMFPQSEKNYSVDASKVPNLSLEDTNTVIAALQKEKGDSTILTSADIERALRLFAQERAENMGREIDDELTEMDYISLARKVVFSGVVFGLGVAKGPYHLKETVRTWTKSPATGAYTALQSTRLKPMFEFMPVWNYYPDLSAKSKDQYDFEFERNPLSKGSVIELKNRPDYMPTAIDEVLRKYPAGNYKEEAWEKDLRSKKSNRENVTDIETNKYEFIECYGKVAGSALAAAGEVVPAEDANKLFSASLVMIGDVVIKAIKSPPDRARSPYHTFVYAEDDISTTGSGLPEVIRDSQMSICEAARMLLDNASAVTGPMLELDSDLLMEGQKLDPHAFKIYIKEGRKGSPSNAGNRAVLDVKVDSHIAELQAIIELFLSFADMETALPPPALGDPSKGGSEALRTQGGASMILGAAALPIRDVVRNFDRFTTSVIGALYDWNMEFRAKPEIKGDFTVIARGSTSLIAKEVRAIQLDQLKVTLSESEMDHIKERRFVEERLKVRDLAEDLLEDEEVVAQKRAARQQAQEKAEALQEASIRATIREQLSAALKNVSQANKNTAQATVEILNTLVEALNGTGEQQAEAGGSSGESAPS